MTAGARARMVVRRGAFTLDVDLPLPAGTTTALLGPNGAGKSTALAALVGLVPLDDGVVTIGGAVVEDVAAGVRVAPERRRVGVVFQDGRLFDHLSVRENVAFGPRARGASRDGARAAADAWLDRLGIAGLAGRRPPALSGGQAQRVALARALVGDPALVALDEPLSALDVAGRSDLRHVLAAHLADVAAPRLLVTHDPVEAFVLADRVVVLEDGRVTQLASPEELRQRPGSTWAADLAGTNLLAGVAEDGRVDVDGHELRIADRGVAGPVLLTLHPHAITLSTARPDGSQRNTWQARVERVEPIGDRVRVSTGAPVPLTAEVTPEAAAELGLVPGARTWLAIKATELVVTPDA